MLMAGQRLPALVDPLGAAVRSKKGGVQSAPG